MITQGKGKGQGNAGERSANRLEWEHGGNGFDAGAIQAG